MNEERKNSTYERLKKLRSTWPAGLNPVTKVIKNKKKDIKRLKNIKNIDDNGDIIER
jgi:hypothetical protein